MPLVSTLIRSGVCLTICRHEPMPGPHSRAQTRRHPDPRIQRLLDDLWRRSSSRIQPTPRRQNGPIPLSVGLTYRDMSALMSLRHAFAYWKTHADQFKRNFYFRGYSGWALRLAQVAFFLAGVTRDVQEVCRASSTAEQERVWQKRLRPIIFNRIMMKGFLGNP